MGTPIKDRGIQWKESYTDKSAYLKEQFEAQVGPGSYFRWEGHDHVSGADYYAVVTPGYSKKHGFHFFAALRKMPADNGASGKKFKNQAEALSYAMETWRVPPPDTQPHQAYVDTDLVGKPIVTENVHASDEADLVKTAEDEATIIIASDEMEKVAMSLPRTGAMGKIFPSRGSKSNAAKMRFAAAAGSIMGLGAAMGLNKEWGLIDVQNQGADKVMDQQSGTQSSSVFPMISTAESPSQERFHQGINVDGYWKLNRLYKIDKKKGAVKTLEPAYTEGQNPGHKIVRFKDADVVPVNISVGQKKYAAFRKVINALTSPPQQLLNSDGTPANRDADGNVLMGHPITDARGRPTFDRNGHPKFYADADGKPLKRLSSKFIEGRGSTLNRTNEDAPRPGTIDDYKVSFTVPIDQFQTFKRAIKSVASIDPLNFKYRNVVDLYDFYDKQGAIRTQEDFNRVQETPIFEAFDLKGGSTVMYDQRGMPIGIKISSDSRIDKESFSEGGQRPDEVQYQFKGGVIENMLRRPEINGDVSKLRWALAKNQIPISHDMLADVRTCAPKLYRIRSVLDRLDANGIPILDQAGNLVKEKTDLTPEFNAAATQGKVRRYDPATGKQVIVPIPQGVEPNQRFRGCQAIVEHAKQYIPVMKPNELGEMQEQLHEIDAGEIKLYDTDTVGSICPGNHYTIMAKAAKLSSKRSDIKTIHDLEQQRIGIYLGYKETYATVKYVKGPPKNRNKTITQLVMKDGRILNHPENPLDDPENEAVRIVSAAMTDRNVAASIDGFYHVHQRQHPPKPLTTAKPSGNAPGKEPKTIKVDRMVKNPDGSVTALTDAQGNVLPPLSIGINDAYEGSGKTPTYFKNMRTIVEFLKAKFAFTDEDVGWWSDVTVSDYRHIDEMNRVASRKIQDVKEGIRDATELADWERLYAEFDPSTDVTPQAFLRRLSQISSTNPMDFAPKRGTIYGIVDQTGAPATEETFVTAEDANAFKDSLQEKLGRTLAVRETRDAELVVRDPSRQGQPLTRNIGIAEAATEFADFGEGEVLSEEEGQQAQIEQSDELGSEEVPTEETEEESDEEQPEAPETQAPAAEAPPAEPVPAPAAPAPAPATEPVSTKREEPLAPAPAPVAPAPAGEVALPPKPRWKPKRPQSPAPAPEQEASAIQRLVKLANKLDQQGKTEEADAVDRLIAITLGKKNQ